MTPLLESVEVRLPVPVPREKGCEKRHKEARGIETQTGDNINETETSNTHLK